MEIKEEADESKEVKECHYWTRWKRLFTRSSHEYLIRQEQKSGSLKER